MKPPIALVNFGGPRTLQEIPTFLTSLLTDQEVVRTGMPPWLHRRVFRKVAKKRALKIAADYASIGGKSPIYFDTEHVAKKLAEKIGREVITFHRYLPSTHKEFCEKISSFNAEEITVMPMFPQFSYATTGSIALWFSKNLPERVLRKLTWIKSYPTHPAYVSLFQETIAKELDARHWKEEETLLLFSPHGIPQKFVCFGDLYRRECESSFNEIIRFFPSADAKLSYQSKFGPGEWLRPYTEDVCSSSSLTAKKQALVVPLSFTSDHIETLYEIEKLYLPALKEQGIEAYRVPAFNRDPKWIEVLAQIIDTQKEHLSNQMLIRYPQMDKWKVPCDREVCVCYQNRK